MNGPRILVWDIETTNLKASFGTMLAVAFKWYDQPKTYVKTILDYQKVGMLDDKPLIADFKEIYATADYTVAHYGKRFDKKFLNTKCLKHRLGPLPEIPMIDTCQVAWDNFLMHSNRLAAWLEYLGCEHEKKAMRTDDWLHAAHGCAKAMKAVKERAKFDVLGLEEVFREMRPWIRNEPARNLFGDCGPVPVCISCGGDRLQHRGYSVTRTRRYARLHCQSCGKWQRVTHAEGGTTIIS
jgi:DNA polymerase III alpha subunit (gram-positive type)